MATLTIGKRNQSVMVRQKKNTEPNNNTDDSSDMSNDKIKMWSKSNNNSPKNNEDTELLNSRNSMENLDGKKT
jgi:hypothetical protein